MNILKNSLIIISLMIIFSCGDEVPLQKNDLKKYPWLTPFIINFKNAEFEGFHNVDLGVIEFNYNISLKNAQDIFMRFDSIAEFNDWKMLKKAELIREYMKKNSQNGKYDNQVLMKIEIDTIEQKLLFEID